jgi:hypothetical protein
MRRPRPRSPGRRGRRCEHGRARLRSGGVGYPNGSPLARAYRYVRTIAFMHPLGADRAYDCLGALALGLEPSLR